MHGHRSQKQYSPVLSTAPTPGEHNAGHSTAAAPSHDAIAHRAYEIYLKSGSKPGHCKQNWQQAETELQAAVGGV